MPLDPSVNAQIQTLVADLETKEQAFSDASDANDSAQTSAQAAVATAAGTLAAKNTAHDAYSASIDALVTFVTGLK
jgi:hypothetical protein